MVMAIALTMAGCTYCQMTPGSEECPIGDPVANCPNDLPASCVMPIPSYATTVSPIFNAYCTTCHSPGGQESSFPLQTYDEIYSIRGEVLDQIYSCRMPLSGEPAPTTDERQALLMWLVCGAPEN
jgi:hypothetical protein